MRRRLASLVLLVLCLLVASVPFAMKPQAIRAQETPENTALAYVAKTYGIPVEQLRVTTRYSLKNRVTGERADGITIRRVGAAVSYKMVVVAWGSVMDRVKYDEIIAAQYRATYGKLSPNLFDLLQTKRPDDRVKVVVWISCNAQKVIDGVEKRYPRANLKGGRPTAGTDRKLYEQIRAEIDASLKEAHALVQEPVLQLIRSRGLREISVATEAPVVFAELPKSLVLEIAGRSDISLVYALRSDYRVALDVAAPAVGAPTVWESGYTGSGIKVAVIEP